VLVRRLVPVLAAAVAVGFAASGCAEQSVGVRVGDNNYSQADMVGELRAYGENEELFPADAQETAQIQGELAGSYNQDFVSQVVTQRASYMVVEQLFDDSDLELTENIRTAAEQELARRIGGQAAVDAFPAEYRQQFIDDEARVQLLLAEMGEDELNSAILDVARSSEIEVSSRFGEWDADQLQVTPPVGSTPAPGSGPDLAAEPGASAPPSG
jgi:hypothetical protein